MNQTATVSHQVKCQSTKTIKVKLSECFSLAGMNLIWLFNITQLQLCGSSKLQCYFGDIYMRIDAQRFGDGLGMSASSSFKSNNFKHLHSDMKVATWLLWPCLNEWAPVLACVGWGATGALAIFHSHHVVLLILCYLCGQRIHDRGFLQTDFRLVSTSATIWQNKCILRHQLLNFVVLNLRKPGLTSWCSTCCDREHMFPHVIKVDTVRHRQEV